MLFTSTIWTYCFHQPDITNRVCLLAPFIMQYLGLLHFVQVIKNCRHGRRSKANFLFVSNEIIWCRFASNCRSNKELPTWPTLKGQIFICIKWGHLVPVLRLTAQVIKNCRHGRRSKANFLFVSNEIIRCLLCVWTTALPQYQWKRCAYFSRTTNSLFCLLVTRMAKVKKSGH